MPRMSKEYCLKTPKSKMGFSQKASCKAQGFIPRTSRKYRGKYIKSPKYLKSRQKSKRKSKRKSRQKRKSINSKNDSGYSKKIKKSKKIVNKSLYSSGTKKPKTITGYGTKEKAIQTLKNIKKFDINYQKQVVNTMYNRAKYHTNQTKGMREAMKVYKEWIKEH